MILEVCDFGIWGISGRDVFLAAFRSVDSFSAFLNRLNESFNLLAFTFRVSFKKLKGLERTSRPGSVADSICVVLMF